jgi:hypothetical protein
MKNNTLRSVVAVVMGAVVAIFLSIGTDKRTEKPASFPSREKS